MTRSATTRTEAQPRPLALLVRDIQAAVARVEGGWVEAEVLKANPWNGMYFLELSGGEDVLADAMVFRQNVRACERELGGGFAHGQQLALKVDRITYGKGRLRLIVSAVRPVGEGELLRRREHLLKHLQSEGVLDRERRSLPAFSGRIGLVCPDNSEAYHDVLKGVRSRWPAADILFAPSSVQGAAAADQMSRAIAALHVDGRAELIVLARGGGGVSDLQPFDTEELARIVAHSPVPILAAIGHTRNRPVCHLVAEWTADVPREVGNVLYPTSAEDIAEELTQARQVLGDRSRLVRCRQALDEMVARIESRQQRILSEAERALAADSADLRRLSEHHLSTDSIAGLRTQLEEAISRARERLSLAAERARFEEQMRAARTRAKRSAVELEEASKSRTRLSRTHLNRRVAEHSERAGEVLHFARRAHQALEKEFQECAALIAARDPVRRGFAVITRKGEPLTTAADASVGDEISIDLRDGALEATVTAARMEKK
jgi:exodeoxyribonuclease VII large subunit